MIRLEWWARNRCDIGNPDILNHFEQDRKGLERKCVSGLYKNEQISTFTGLSRQ